ncbi:MULTISPECIES: FmdB family zinc ribbon protein [Streptomyces]
MARYDYACGHCGVFEVVRPIDAPAHEPTCVTCGAAATRVYAPPALTSPGSALRRARDAADASAHEPTVLHGTPAPPRGPARPARPARPPNPLHARLPKP